MSLSIDVVTFTSPLEPQVPDKNIAPLHGSSQVSAFYQKQFDEQRDENAKSYCLVSRHFHGKFKFPGTVAVCLHIAWRQHL